MKKSKIKDVRLVNFDGKELRAGTLIIAKGFNHEHKYILGLIRKYQENFEELSLLKSKSFKTKGQTGKEYLLTELQTAFLGTLFRNSEIVVDFKLKLVKEFGRMKDALARIKNQRNDPEWQQTRIEGKPDRFSLTDALKSLRLLAIEQNPDTTYKNKEDAIYLNYTKMIYKALFIFNIPVKKVRGFLNKSQLRDLANIEIIVSKLVVVLTLTKLNYKKTYRLAKEKAENYGGLVGKTEVIKMDKQLSMF